MDYFALDTNIFISLCLKRIDSITSPCYTGIKKLLDKNKIELVIPEIVRIEFKRNIEPEFENSQRFIGGLIKDLDKVVLPLDITDSGYSWAEIDQLRSEIKDNLQKVLSKFKATRIEDQIKPVLEIMDHRNTKILPTSDKLIVKAYRRALEQKAPAHKKRSEADCLIVESLIQYFSEVDDKEKAFFISYNRDDFADPNDNETWHPDLLPVFKKLGIEYYPHLVKVLKEKYKMEIKRADIEFEKELIETYEEPAPPSAEHVKTIGPPRNYKYWHDAARGWIP